ncbi:MAG: GNAT family N-acetyltransferase [bacterium]|nr:GNAT family N-acetyltransferase [bacterium]
MIRKATKTDILKIHQLIQEAAKKHRVLPRSKKELSDVIDSFFVFETNGNIIACCALEIYNKKIAEIRSLVVDTKERNKGIGKLLIQACIEKAKKEKLREILSITDKVDFFKKCGFDTCLNKQYAMFIHP